MSINDEEERKKRIVLTLQESGYRDVYYQGQMTVENEVKYIETLLEIRVREYIKSGTTTVMTIIIGGKN